MTKDDFANGLFDSIEIFWPDYTDTFSVCFVKGLDVVEQYQTGLSFEQAFDVCDNLRAHFGVPNYMEE